MSCTCTECHLINGKADEMHGLYMEMRSALERLVAVVVDDKSFMYSNQQHALWVANDVLRRSK